MTDRHSSSRKALLAAGLAAALGLTAATALAHGPGSSMPQQQYGWHYGWHMGPQMMGPGMGQGMMGYGCPMMSGCGMTGPQMMGPGYGMMGPQMMGPGYGMMGPNMMNQGMMGPGYGMMGPGYDGDQDDMPMTGPRGQGMGPGMGQGMGQGMGPGMMQQQRADITPDDVKRMLERQLAWQGNPHLKVGNVEAKDDNTIVAEIVTQDNSLVERYEVDRHTGAVRVVR